MAELPSRSDIFLAVLLHDVGKAVDETTHADVGATMAEKVGQRWGLSLEMTELMAWLVQEHLSMTRMIRLRDLSHPQTVEDLATLVGDSRRLDLLTLLTYADVAAVGPAALTPALENYLCDLHGITVERLNAGASVAPDPQDVRRRLLRELRESPIPAERVREFLESLPAHYWAGATPETVRLHMLCAERARHGEPTLDAAVRSELAATVLTVCAPDSPGLLYRILGVIYALDASLVAVKAFTTLGPPAIAIDEFTISYGGGPVPNATMKHMQRQLMAVLKGEAPVEQILRQRGKDPERLQHMLQYSFAEGDPAVLEFNAPRGRGLAYRLARLISAQGWNVLSARVGQWAGAGAAAFYVTGLKGALLTREQVEKALGPRTPSK
jgi:[protein-PII] uridylyltransferase